ncbi:TniB family NTP-binding protein [Nocardia asteroides]|uniref:TniB family NTP-binding protein n=1 Tax=Nocardia asteroides TaxID=1824 RepID=UPI00342E5D06
MSITADPVTEPVRQLTTLTGWRQFTRDKPVIPPLLPTIEWEHLGDTERGYYDETRIDYHTRLTVIATSTVRNVAQKGRRLTLLNRHAVSARRGMILSGAAGTGKTTAITQFGKMHEAADQARHPHRNDRIPVLYATVPPAATPRMLAAEFARFLGLPVTHRANLTDIIEAVCGVCCDTGTSVVICDELHNISLATKSGAEVSDTLKYFSERIPATFVYAGINVEREGLFSGTRGEQIAGRFTMIRTVGFPCTADWRAVVATLENTLRLHNHTPGTLTDLDRYLHKRTSGMIGSLSALIREAALEAILTGAEKITKPMLDAIDLDHAATESVHRNGKPS